MSQWKQCNGIRTAGVAACAVRKGPTKMSHDSRKRSCLDDLAFPAVMPRLFQQPGWRNLQCGSDLP
jgi:hypothetical protein